MPTIGGVTVNWDETKPAGADSLSIGDNQIRSDKTALRSALAAEHNFDGSGGANTGYHAFGSARPFYGAQSAVSSSGSDGRLMLTSDTSRLFAVGSGGTVFLGGPTAISAANFPGSVPQRSIWVQEFGQATIGASGSSTVPIPNSGYSGVPTVLVTVVDATSQGSHFAYIISKTATSFVVATRNHAGTLVNAVVDWLSIGSRSL